ncbi:deoxyxylulose-5-phosphate synthase [Beutenbergia cavernae DSM 12333]|uniref:1-deoxy-D-xylulose-5-phosphate synthase n=1 Tax=Beutenbergia cavernae (strain ATCC BAA-8 / DSM 12333 / CCUG 43141 / JCM 11478 / NBRC 16432 / NCIMB 13614 / HKI 0122) TaxID=471853 RepID=C5C5M2_BEUC1|nr:1-deoxy-D-xylulose-5-phosphate synthase [Beutenbergia cavernae]ACQ80213.1 deoxyxylulose-5-phosphate synthase [Beutenbergia cavernae DSM 12333]
MPDEPRILPTVTTPRDLRRLKPAQLDALAAEIRDFLVTEVSKTGGHLGPNLGVVELTIALHRVFSSPTDRLVFDTGHQAYVHKLLTGRQDFSRLRGRGGLSGYPSRAESDHDVVENSHASAALSWADGIARANQVAGLRDRHVVAVVGDGALTGGMAWEALNNISSGQDRRLVVVVNDNGRSYSPTIGGLAQQLDTLRTTQSYERVLALGKATLQRGGPPGRFAYDALHGLKKGLKDVARPQGLFEDLGIKYVGPVDGHDRVMVEHALRRAKAFDGPVIVHVITEKGRGYTPAEEDVADRFHAVGKIHPETGLPVAPSRFGWTAVFADEIVAIARQRSDVVGVTAAMLHPVGLAPMAEEFPDRVFDVGIAEQHAVTSAAGMAFAGLHPVIGLYATFLGRGFDQLLMDVGLHKAGVTFVLDRAGLTGEDGASHNGMWDIAMTSIVPGLRLAAPRDETTLREELREAVAVDDAPTVLRYPKGALPEALPAVQRVGGAYGPDVLARHAGDGGARVLVVGVGAFAACAVEVGERLAQHGIGGTVVDPRWVLPVGSELLELAQGHDLVVTVEDGLVTGGAGSHLRDALAAAGTHVPVQSHGIPRTYLEHASRAELVAELGLRPADVAREAASAVAHLTGATEPATIDR